MMYEVTGSLAEVCEYIDATAKLCSLTEDKGQWTVTLIY